ncbi:MAG TPA: tRNA pseudouridine(55) synthase TruB [Cyanobacteria bacterium UBA11149]|nr:tRNA pseudouridine(55) synthase TruB [Cyanobacteria bacterium UBA11367]HBE57538.1 tRNA pseudouridine(55) synthase TruB [Cyanobacteria bacterium UBA11366]HBK64888.1 tRNA pseudouridine(55) synthase TruB [Cyanobacteria bacterium UBA11166]HBR74373.1 tRNA pseudouridine(55) synthase TruB [Cyanobacteria bacterium UBA11159]HBS70524.1 tRNA pseudouridine(55) synthase TruB [Cyanobacteria bacterium UBA11153]HBW91655.1 tRNA pseudouridine(55) synthase TruB [Cyanobacteria bacterium UBA11149]HCA95586.1 tR
MNGFLNLNKPDGFTSHDCVAKVRRLLGIKKVGHGGTLDPAATGVLPIAIGKATRLLQYMAEDKGYQAKIRLGVKTTTDDLEGEVIATQSASDLTLEKVLPLLSQFQGKIQQTPPIYSAIQVKGKRLYDLARRGEEVEVPVREVEIYRIEVLNWRGGEFPEIDLAIASSPGTYIRAIARDLGAYLNIGGTLASLIRTQSCGFNLADSLTFEELETQLQTGIFVPIPPTAGLTHLPSLTLPVADASRWCQGQRIPYRDEIASPNEGIANLSESPLTVYGDDGYFLGIGKLAKSETEVLLFPVLVWEASGKSG